MYISNVDPVAEMEKFSNPLARFYLSSLQKRLMGNISFITAPAPPPAPVFEEFLGGLTKRFYVRKPDLLIIPHNKFSAAMFPPVSQHDNYVIGLALPLNVFSTGGVQSVIAHEFFEFLVRIHGLNAGLHLHDKEFGADNFATLATSKTNSLEVLRHLQTASYIIDDGISHPYIKDRIKAVEDTQQESLESFWQNFVSHRAANPAKEKLEK